MQYVNKERTGSARRASFVLWVKRLIEVDPKYPRKKCQDRDKGQEEEDSPDCDLVHTPTSQCPEDRTEDKNESKGQSVTDVHRAKKVSGLTVEMETADRTAIIHLGKTPIKVGAKNCGGPAPGTELAEDAD